MNKLFISVAMAALIALSSTVSAQAKKEVDVKRTVWELSDFPELEKSAKAVCGSKAVLSIKLQDACKADKFPRVTKAGAFYNNGIGSELNALIRQATPGNAPIAATETK